MATPQFVLEQVVDAEGSVTILARIAKIKGEFGDDGQWLAPDHIDELEYTIYDRETEEAVEGHDGVEITVADAIEAALVTTEPLWTKDTIGFNFIHKPKSVTGMPFPVKGTQYVLKYVFTPAGSDATPFTLPCLIETSDL